MTRRSFLSRLGASVVAFTLARHLPGIAPAPPVAPLPKWGESLQVGDVFTVEGQFRFDPVTRRPDPALGLQQFTVTASTGPGAWVAEGGV